jgi:uncharacterized protein (DUF488 family)
MIMEEGWGGRVEGGRPAEPILLTVGHGTLSSEELLVLLRGAAVASVVDIRIAPGSRRHPHLARDRLELWLPDHGISYRWDKRLGGFRQPPTDSSDTALRNPSFRGYAAWMRGSDFAAALDRLRSDVVTSTRPPDRTPPSKVAMMCSESVWWRCHRRLVADAAVLGQGNGSLSVRHLMHDGRLVPHVVTDGVRRMSDGLLVYDAGAQRLPET